MEKDEKRESGESVREKGTANVYKKVVEYEKKESRTRDCKEDTDMYIKVCADIRTVLREICKLKCAQTEDAAAVKEKKFQACVLTSALKRLNRLEKVRLSAARKAINTEKQKVESRYMQYQNLLYEVDHYNSEYSKCMQYKSRDEEIDLISTAEFFLNAPEEVTDKFLGEEEKNHELYLARLDFELKQRIHLARILEDLKVEKKVIKEDIAKMKIKLTGMEPKLMALVASTKPLQEHLGLTIGDLNPEHKLACHLPDPLYLFYCNVDSYRQFIAGDGLAIEIKGNLAELEQYKEAQQELEEDSDNEPDMPGETSGVKKHRRRKSIAVGGNNGSNSSGSIGGGGGGDDPKKKNVLQKHPLGVKVTVKVEAITLRMQFSYLPHLRIVTVTPQTECALLHGSACARDVLAGESILNQLYAHDAGTESPNLVNHFQLKQVGVERFQAVVPQIGFAYNWAQRLCGLDFLNRQNFEQRLRRQDTIYLHTVERTILMIKRRMQMRTALAAQLHQLEQCVVPAVPEFIVYPKSSVAALAKFASTSFQRFCAEARNARDLLDKELVGPDDLFYLATIVRVKATLLAWIVIRNEYPEETPMFVVQVKLNGERSGNYSEEMRDLERSVNVGWQRLAQGKDMSGWLLAAQLKYLCALMDVYLETNDDTTFPITTVFFRRVLGRNRKRPFKFRKPGNGIFTQY